MGRLDSEYTENNSLGIFNPEKQLLMGWLDS